MEKKTNKNRATWYKLDLSANVYPTLQRKNFSSVYRITMIMKEEVDPPPAAEGCGSGTAPFSCI